MKELKCPKCSTMFTVNEADFETIVSQVRNQEFAAEVAKREQEIREKLLAEQKVAQATKEQSYQAALSAKAVELEKKEAALLALQTQLQNFEQVKNAERQAAVIAEQKRLQDSLNNKDAEIANLKATMAKTVSELEANAKLQAQEEALKEQKIRGEYEQLLKAKDQELEFHKNYKAKLSTKMLGESLEQHCSILFEQQLRMMMPSAYFEKDNDASQGSKGDFIFRDSVGEQEYISIMFEMKNESDETATKHKNEDFFKKLDEDRRKKNCEYAVLVSMLEPENELYNQGIVAVHQYEKMFVVRPQLFTTLIMLLVNANKKSISLQHELAIARNQSVDVTKFESQLTEFKEKFGRNYRLASDHFHTAIAEIDKTIDHLQKVKKGLELSTENLRLADRRVEDLTIKKLTRGNATMKKLFEDAQIVTDEE